MQLTSHTDYGLRVLMVLGAAAPLKVRTAEIGEMFDISEHHLVKIIQNLARHGYVETMRGKAGGVRLARCASDINIGQVVREMEAELGVVPCLQREGAECFITPVCGLKVALAQATLAFLSHLDTVTLKQLLLGTVEGGPAALVNSLADRLPQLIPLRASRSS